MKELISIIVPIYNVKEKFLNKCLESIMRQTYNNIEVILVDDGSDKWCRNIYEPFLKYKNFKCIIQKNSGVSVARNTGMANATGDYIIFIDSDDWIEESCCEKMIKAITASNADILIAKAFKDIGDDSIDYTYKKSIVENKLLDVDEKDDLIKSIFLDSKTGSKFYYADTPWAKMFNLKFIKNNKLSFKNNLKLAEDGLFNFEAYIKAEKIYFINECLYHYVKNNESVCNKFNSFIIENYKIVFEYYNELFNKIKIEKYSHEYRYFIYRQLLKQIKKYICNKENNKIYCERKKEFHELISMEPYFNVLKNKDYKLYFNAEVYYVLIKYKMFFILDFLCKR